MIKTLIHYATLLGYCAFLSFSTACSEQKEEIDNLTESAKLSSKETKSTGNFHWICKKNSNGRICNFLNPGWRNNCAACREPYSAPHAKIVQSVITMVKKEIITTVTAPGPDLDRGPIQLPDLTYPIYAPEPWYDTNICVGYYNRLKDLYYNTNQEYAEGVDIGWYRTSRILYPGNTIISDVKRFYDRFIVTDGSSLRGSKGAGLKAGTKAAIDAFYVY